MAEVPIERPAGFWRSLARLYRALPPARRRQLYVVLALMCVTAVVELATISAVVPMLDLLVHRGSAGPVSRIFAFGSGSLTTATILFIAFVVFAGAARLQLVWSTQQLIFGFAHELSTEIDRRILNQPYSFHITSHSSTLIAALEKVQLLAFNVLLPLLQMVTAILVSVVVVGALIAVDPLTALIALIGFGVIYVAIALLTRRRLAENSAVLASAYDQRIKIVQESLGGIRDIIIDGSADLFVDAFRVTDARLASAIKASNLIATTPRVLVEILGMALIAALAIVAAGRPGGFTQAVPLLGAIALGAQRLLPFVQQIYSGWALISGNMSVVGQVADLAAALEPPAQAGEDVCPLHFTKKIRVEDVTFSYAAPPVTAVRDVTLAIPRGAILGLAGRSGSGKSTLADLLMGLLEPTLGTIAVDGIPLDATTRRRWWRSIAHVPQTIFLIDDSIAANIAFGVPASEIDMLRVTDAAVQAHLHSYIDGLPSGYATKVGERGIALSAGQRQRLGLARAIYRGAALLVLDEPTSALDSETEAAVLDSILRLQREGRTIVVIAHGKSVLRHCTMVVRLENGRVVETRTE